MLDTVQALSIDRGGDCRGRESADAAVRRIDEGSGRSDDVKVFRNPDRLRASKCAQQR
jgi:hypothetical protein